MTETISEMSIDGLVFTVDETQKLLKLGRTATYEAIRRGDIPSIKIGGRVLVPKSGLLRLIGEGGEDRGNVVAI